jgi:hypothetical protein
MADPNATLSYASTPGLLLRRHPELGTISIDIPARHYSQGFVAVAAAFIVLVILGPIAALAIYQVHYPGDPQAKVMLVAAPFPLLLFGAIFLAVRGGAARTYIQASQTALSISISNKKDTTNFRIPRSQIASISMRQKDSEMGPALCIQRERYDAPDTFLQQCSEEEIRQVVEDLKGVLKVS